MAGIPGTNVAAMVVPFDTQDIYATHNDKYGRGGFRVVDSISDRDAISELRRKRGMWVRVLSDGKVYEMGAGLSNSDWIELDISGGTGGGYTPPTVHSITPASQQTILENLSLSTNSSAKWLVTAVDSTLQVSRTCEITAAQTYLGDVRYNISNVIGDSMSIKFEVISQAGNMSLVVNNNSNNAVTVDAVRFATVLK